MEEDDLDIWITNEGATHDEVDGGFARFVRVVDNGFGEFGVDETGVNDMSWVDKDDGRAAIDFFL